MLFVSHEASLTGAPIMLLHLMRWMRDNATIDMQVALLSGGELADEFAEVAPVTVLGGHDAIDSAQRRLLRRVGASDPILWSPPPGASAMERFIRLRAGRELARRLRRELMAHGRPDLIYLNSTVSCMALPALPRQPPLLTHAHEMGWALRGLRRRAPQACDEMLARTVRYVAAARSVQHALVDVLGVERDRITVQHEAVPVGHESDPEASQLARLELGLSSDTLVVGTVGAMNWRKAPDLFLHVAKRTIDKLAGRDVAFLWVGPVPGADMTDAQVRHDLTHAGLEKFVRFLGPREDPRPLLGLFDVFVLTSREDPFPLACLEAAAAGKPVVCFEAGGMSEFLAPSERLVVPYLDIEAMSSRIVELLLSDADRAAIGRSLAERVRERHSIERTAPALVEQIELALTTPT